MLFRQPGPALNTDTTDKAVVRAFEKAGYTNIVLFDRTKDLKAQAAVVTVLTYKRWLELGRKVRAGEHSIKARGYHIRLFHRDQCHSACNIDPALPHQ